MFHKFFLSLIAGYTAFTGAFFGTTPNTPILTTVTTNSPAITVSSNAVIEDKITTPKPVIMQKKVEPSTVQKSTQTIVTPSKVVSPSNTVQLPSSSQLAGLYKLCSDIPVACKDPTLMGNYYSSLEFRAAIDYIVLEHQKNLMKTALMTHVPGGNSEPLQLTQARPNNLYVPPTINYPVPVSIHCTSHIIDGGLSSIDSVYTNCY